MPFYLGRNAISAYRFSNLRITYFNLRGKTTKQLKFHSLSRPRTTKYVINYIRAGREVMLEDRLASTLHISQDCLPEVPTQKLIDGSLRIIKKLLIEVLAADILPR